MSPTILPCKQSKILLPGQSINTQNWPSPFVLSQRRPFVKFSMTNSGYSVNSSSLCLVSTVNPLQLWSVYGTISKSTQKGVCPQNHKTWGAISKFVYPKRPKEYLIITSIPLQIFTADIHSLQAQIAQDMPTRTSRPTESSVGYGAESTRSRIEHSRRRPRPSCPASPTATPPDRGEVLLGSWSGPWPLGSDSDRWIRILISGPSNQRFRCFDGSACRSGRISVSWYLGGRRIGRWFLGEIRGWRRLDREMVTDIR